MQIPQEHIFSAFVGDKEVIIKAGKLAQQAGAAVTVQMGDTMLLCTATMNPVARPGTDFLPLSVDFEERLYAAGRIPGSFMRREGRPSERGILTSRVTDRSLRPLFPKHMHNDVQVIVLSLAHDRIHDVDMLSIIASSAALMISDIPWAGPIAGVRIGLINNELVVNPTIPEMENSVLDLRVAGSADAIIMVECTAKEVPEDTMLAALNLAHASIQDVIALQNEMQKAIGKVKVEIPEEVAEDEDMRHHVLAKISEDVVKIVATKTDRDERQVALDDLHERIIGDFTDEEAVAAAKTIRDAISDIIRDEVRRRIVEESVRPDGRSLEELRPIWAEVDVIPRVHGSGLFNRGQTQVLGICTLGTPADSQLLDNLHPEDNKRYMHHYNFPPYSTGETSPLRGPKRREIGHGALAENALLAVLPSEEDFPYTIRVVSEVLSSNGSSSMASVCASTLALMDAGVPLREAVAGIAMGLIQEGDKYTVLTDIQGLEDHLGDMDFKVAGTRNGINALQMDIKIKGVPGSVMEQALSQAYNARIQILEIMAEAIAAPRPQLNPNAPRMEIVQIEVDKIGALIGPGGKNIRSIQESTGTKIEIREDGRVFIAGPDGTSTQRAIDRISGLTETPQPGKVYTGKISRIEDYGVFVELMPGLDGLVHISQLADYKIMNIREEFSLGDEIMVMIIDVDPAGKVRLSRQAVIEGWTLEEAREKDKGGKRGGGGDRGGDRRGGGGDRGGDRGPRRDGGNFRGGSSGGGDRSGGGGGDRSGGSSGPRRYED